MRAILVEDDADLRRRTREVLTRLGYVSIDGDDLDNVIGIFLQWSKAPPPALLVVDVALPGPMDGIDVLCGVRKARIERDWWPEDHTPAIVVTSGIYKETHGVAEIIRKNRAVFLPKPYTSEQLSTAIEEAQRAATEWGSLSEIKTVSPPRSDAAAADDAPLSG